MNDWYYRYLIREAFSLLFVGTPLAILIWAILRWAHSLPRIVEPAWRSYVAAVAFSLAGISWLFLFIVYVWDRVIHGFPYYDPILLAFIRLGALTSFVGLLVSFLGKGKLRWPACAVSSLMVLLWLIAALAE